MNKNYVLNRRRFLAGVAAIPLLEIGRPVFAQTLPIVSETDPTAAALGYKHNVADINTMMFTRRSTEANGESQFCHTCAYYSGVAGEEWGPCMLFPGKSVSANGWCNVWAPKPA